MFKDFCSILESSLPNKPYCTDAPHNGLLIRNRASALKFPHIQFNGPLTFAWMLFDIDRRDSYFAHEDAILPPPNFISINPKNGHAHAGLLLDAPVYRHSAARLKPLQFYAAVERGMTRRLRADVHYAGLIAKNPLHPMWRTEVRRLEPYTLEDLASWLRHDDMMPPPRIAENFGAGRNVSVFDALRSFAYRQVLAMKSQGASHDMFRIRCEDVGAKLNQQFAHPMRASEVRAIAKSVAKWTWRNFNSSDFSELQSERAHRRWQGHNAIETTKPWQAENISRRTWYRRRAAGNQQTTREDDT